jgi:hypothetical protein
LLLLLLPCSVLCPAALLACVRLRLLPGLPLPVRAAALLRTA